LDPDPVQNGPDPPTLIFGYGKHYVHSGYSERLRRSEAGISVHLRFDASSENDPFRVLSIQENRFGAINCSKV
jgi:hypothetical protein